MKQFLDEIAVHCCQLNERVPNLAESSAKLEPSAKVSRTERNAHCVYVWPPCSNPFLQPNLVGSSIGVHNLSRNTSPPILVFTLGKCCRICNADASSRECPWNSGSEQPPVPNRDLRRDVSKWTELLSCLLDLRSASVSRGLEACAAHVTAQLFQDSRGPMMLHL